MRRIKEYARSFGVCVDPSTNDIVQLIRKAHSEILMKRKTKKRPRFKNGRSSGEKKVSYGTKDVFETFYDFLNFVYFELSIKKLLPLDIIYLGR